MRVAGYLGGKHVTFNMPLFRRDFAAQATKADIDALLRGIQQHTETVDVLALVRQPKSWIGIDNPLALLPSQASTNDCPVLKMVPGEAATDRISNSFRKRLEDQGRQVPKSCRLSLHAREDGGRGQARARRLLRHQAAAHGRTEPAQRLRRARRRSLHPPEPARRRARMATPSISTRSHATRK